MLKCVNKSNLETAAKKAKWNETRNKSCIFSLKTVGNTFLQTMSQNGINLEKNYLHRGSARAIEIKLREGLINKNADRFFFMNEMR